MNTKDNKVRVKIYSMYLAMYIPLLIMYKLLGRTFTREVEGINFIMTGIAIPCCIIYYKITKKKNALLLLMFFLSMMIDNTYIHLLSYYKTIDRTVPLLVILRNIIIGLLIILNCEKVIDFLFKNRVIVFLSFIGLNIVILATNEYVSEFLYSRNFFNIFFKSSLIIVSLSIIWRVIQSFKDKEFIELVFLCSLMILILRRTIVLFKGIYGFEGVYLLDEKWVFCLALYMLPTGLFVENSCLIKENSSLMKEVKIISNDIKEYQEIDKLRTQFFANMSHELKTPVNIIFSGIQLIESKRQIGEMEVLDCYNKYEPILKQNCFRILRLTNNIVDMTKFDAGFMKMNFQNVDIVSLVEDITMSVVQYVENKNINIIFDTLIEEKIIRCDIDGMERIILNLISNAIKFTNEGGNILVFMEMEEGYVVIKVKDDGIGIPKENRESIFNVFVQGDKSLNRAREGSGIGLSLVKAIVENHEGNVECNDVEKGTEIIIKLPDIKIAEDEDSYNKISQRNDLISKINTEFSDIYGLQ